MQRLKDYGTSELVRAFERAEREVSAFPTVSHLVEYIEKPRFHEALGVVIRGLRVHGVGWERIPGQRHRDSEDAEWIIDKNPIELPELPPRMVRALEIFGGGETMHAGLKRLKRDSPNFWTGDTEYVTGQHGRQASAIERDFYQCWMEAM